MRSVRSILVRGPNWLGDLVMATPGFRALREGFPDARIALHVRSGFESLVRGSPWFDEVIPLSSTGSFAPAFAREAARLRRRRFDLGVCLPDSLSSALLMRLGGVRHVAGYATAGRGALLDVAVDPPPRFGGRRLVPREGQALELVAALGCPPRGTRLELFVTDEEDQRARALLAERGGDPDGALALLAPGAAYGPAKQWPAASYAAAGDALADAGFAVALVGAPQEAPLLRRVATGMRRAAAVLAPELDLGALKALARAARVVICNDAGVRHVAVAFGTPCVVLLGPTSLAKTPWNLAGVRVLHAGVGCRPCYHRECPVDHRCMTRLAPERVVEAALAAARAAPRAPADRRPA